MLSGRWSLSNTVVPSTLFHVGATLCSYVVETAGIDLQRWHHSSGVTDECLRGRIQVTVIFVVNCGSNQTKCKFSPELSCSLLVTNLYFW